MTDTSDVPLQPQRSHNLAIGAHGEHIAADYLSSIGCEILARNWRFGRTGELDLVVREHDTLVAVEVKTRSGSGYGSPFEAITPRKAARLRSLLLNWVHAHRPISGNLRIDAIAITLIPGQPARVAHIRGIG